MPYAPKPLRQTLLHGASLSALLVAATAGSPARGSGYRSLNAALNAAPASVAASAAAGLTAARQASLGTQNLAAASARFRSLQQALSAVARPVTGGVPNGLVVGGLQIGDGVSSDGGKTVTAPALWNGAGLPSQSAKTPGLITVDQTAPLARLTWKTFNVGPQTHLNFDQTAGGSQASGWVVINSIQDPAANPSVIEGQISAIGKVYVLNRNGIAFGVGSQVNVGSLIAATADIANSQFMANATGGTTFNLYGAQSGAGFAPTFTNGVATSTVTVSAGAEITTAAPATGEGGGYVMLLGGTVQNSGTIMTPQGQTVLAGGTAFTLRQGSTGTTGTGNTTSTTLGSEVDATNRKTASGNGPIFVSGTVSNDGLIVADQGDISLVGHALTQAGVLVSTTTVNTRGTIHLLTDTTDATASVVLAPGSVTEILPEDDGLTALDSQRAANIAASGPLNMARAVPASLTNPQLGDRSALPDEVGEGRIELSSGGSVDLQPGAIALAQGGQVAVGAGKSVLVEGGATIDVSGTDTAVLPAGMNDLLISVQPYQLRDSAGNRDGALKSTNLNVDARTLVEIAGSGPYAGNIYTPGGLLEVGGYLGLVPHHISEWTALGGQVTLQAPSVGGTVTTAPGSVIDVQGGTVNYAAGLVNQSYVVASDGTVYDVNTAPGNLVYTGVYTGDLDVHARWHVTDSYINPLLTPASIEEAAYSVGRDAGTLTVNGTSVALQGTVAAGVSEGAAQTGARPSGVTDSYLLAQSVVPLAGTLRIGGYVGDTLLAGVPGDILFDDSGTASTKGTASIDSGAISTAGFATLEVTAAGDITVAAPLSVANGGTISLVGTSIEADANIAARGGAIVLSNQFALTGAPVGPGTPSITLGAGAVLDASGVWTNALLDPVHVSGEALAHGGTVTIQGNGAVNLAAGSAINVSSGGALLGNGKLLQAAGGSISVTADVEPLLVATQATAPVTLDTIFAGYGTSGGGTLSLEVPDISLGGSVTGTSATDLVVLANSLLQTGFSSYVLNGTTALSVAADQQVSVAEPIFTLGGTDGGQAPTGSDQGQVFSVILPGLYTPNRGGDTVAQRAGASISLLSSVAPASAGGGGGAVTIDAGATVTVDPGQSIAVVGYGEVTELGALIAHGGKITVASSNFDNQTDKSGQDVLHYQPGVTVTIGSGATLDASGQAVVFVDSAGRRFTARSALTGGSIALGGNPTTGESTTAPVVVDAGAVVDADGASVTVDTVPLASVPALVLPSSPITLAGAGGTITAASIDGMVLDGALTAAAGGPTAAGGLLALRIDPITLESYADVPDALFQPREIVVSDATAAKMSDDAAAPIGSATVSQAQIDAGGFDQVQLTAQDAVVFDGDVSLHAGRSIAITAGLVGDTVATGIVSIAAPHVSFSSVTTGDTNGGGVTSVQPTTGTLSVAADLIDFSEDVVFGGTKAFGVTEQTSVFGFAQSDFVSSGDIRTLGSASAQARGFVKTAGDFSFTAAQLLPASQQTTTIYAGLNPAAKGTTSALAGGTITVLGNGGGTAQAISAGGTLGLVAETIVQDGVIRAPEGNIRLGYNDFDDLLPNAAVTATTSVVLDAGSVTSVSLIGQTIPFGGTVDGVNYLVAGATAPVFSPAVEVDSERFAANTGAVLDLRGGGTLSGAGFVVGRGGSADVLHTPLLDISGAAALANALAQVSNVAPLNSGDAVYAILPGYDSAYAPTTSKQDAGYTPTVTGEQITVGSEVPGLAAGTYTLLPAYYALLPGGYRVELTNGTVTPASLASLGNGVLAAPVSVSIAGTDIQSQVPVAALFTGGAGVRSLSQYDEESYNDFERGAGTQFGTPRPFIPDDAKTLLLNYPSQIATGAALTFDASVLLKAPAPAIPATQVAPAIPAGDGMILEINTGNLIEITAAGSAATGSMTAVALDAGVLSALDVPRLVLGGTVTVNGNQAEVAGNAAGVTIDPGALLQAGEVMIATNISGSITVSSRAIISTIGEGSTAFDISQGYYFNNLVTTGIAAPVLDVSNGQIIFTPNTGVANGASIDVQDNASLLSSGSLDFVAPEGTNVGIGQVTLGGLYVNLQVSTLNLGSSTALSDYNRLYPGQLPTGLTLSQSTLDLLLNGNPALVLHNSAFPTGSMTLQVPAASSLALTANLATNIIGNATPLVAWQPGAYAVGQTVLNGGAVFVCIGAGTSTGSGPSTTGMPPRADGTAVWQFQNPSDATGGDLNAYALVSASTGFVLNTPAIYGFGIAGDTAVIQTPSFTWNGVLTQNLLQVGPTASIAASALPAGQIAGSAANVAPSLAIDAQKIVLGYGPQTQPNDQVQLDRLVVGFADVTLSASSNITANTKSSLSVYATQDAYGQPGAGGNLTLSAPLVTTDSAAVLKITSGGTLALSTPAGVTAAPTAGVTTLGGEIDLLATEIDLSTAVALPAGRFTATAQNDISIAAGTSIDLAGRSTAIFDQVAQSPGGTLLLESTVGNIAEASGASIDVSSPGAAAGSIGVTALAGSVTLDGSLAGTAALGQTSGNFSVIAGTLAGFDSLNTTLDTGGFAGSRSFEIATGDVDIDQTLHASTLSVTADAGSITIGALLDASGGGPGSIALNAGGDLTLESTAVLDAHATTTAVDSYGEEIDASNRAHVTLAATTGSLTLDGGATIDVAYPDASRPQGQVVLNAPRTTDSVGVAASVTGAIDIVGAQSVALYAWRTYMPTNAVGGIGATQVIGHGGSNVGLDEIEADNTAWASHLSGPAIQAKLGNITSLMADGQSAFHLRPGVEIDSSSASGGDLTVTGDLDFSGLRISDPAGFGLSVSKRIDGSGEPGAIVFRAANMLVVNGSISDGFAPPPDSRPGNAIPEDKGWVFVSPNFSPAADPLNADIYLPASVRVTVKSGGSTTTTDNVRLGGETDPATSGTGTTFDTSRAISLNYDIHIVSANLNPNVVIPFSATLVTNGNGPYVVPAGGFVATAALTTPTHTYARGDLVPGGTLLPGTTKIAAGSVLPFSVAVRNGTLVPAGTLLTVFADPAITLFSDTGNLPVDAFIPADTIPVFLSQTDKVISRLELREPQGANKVQGYLYPLAAMLPAGSQSWDLSLVAGADQASADRLAVLPHSQLDGGALAPAATLASQAPGTLLLDDQHYATASTSDLDAVAAFSVIRTGTGDLNLLAGGNFDQSSLFGIYTAGTQTFIGTGPNDGADAPFDRGREPEGKKGALLPGSPTSVLNRIVTNVYRAYYPNGGGDVLLAAQGSATGDLYDNAIGLNNYGTSSAEVGNWLWRQGSTQLGIPTAWWINFGTFTVPYTPANTPTLFAPAQLVGFQGIGTLGGGNLTVNIGGDAGQTTDRTGENTTESRGEGLIFTVASTGRLVDGTTPVITGGGSLTLHIGGTLNPLDAAAYGTNVESEVNGAVIDLRGNITVSAGAVGRVDTVYDGGTDGDPRATDPFAVSDGAPAGGLTLIPGDGTVQINTMRDLVVEGAADAGRVPVQNLVLITRSLPHGDSNTGGDTAFSLWTEDTGITLFSAGGNLTPTSQPSDPFSLGGQSLITYNATDYRFLYPPTLLATAATGSLIYGSETSGNNILSLETMPSPTGQVALLAGNSIFANGFAIDMSGANPALLSTPASPSFTSDPSFLQTSLTNVRSEGGTPQSVLPLFGQEADTPTGDLHAGDPTPALFYAYSGDIVDLITGETITYDRNANEPLAQWYLAAKPVWIMAGQDIVSSGTRPDTTEGVSQQNQQALVENGVAYATASGDLFYNNTPASISVVSAGRDILSGFFYVGGSSSAGAGLLEVDAGRNLFQAAANTGNTQELDFGAIKSIGALIAGSPLQLGADISVLAGVGTDPNYEVFADIYLNPANLANPALPIADPRNIGKVQEVYGGTDAVPGQSQLLSVLQQRNDLPATATAADALAFYQALTPEKQASLTISSPGMAALSPLYAYLLTLEHYDSTEAGAFAVFRALPTVDQTAFLRQVFFNETTASGLQYNDPTSRFYQSAARGRVAIDSFFLPLAELNDYLAGTTGYTGGQANAAAYFAGLTVTQQQPFIDAIFKDDEIPRASSNATISTVFTDLLRSTGQALGSSFFDTKSPGVPDGYDGAMTMYSGPVTVAGSTTGPLSDASGGTATFDAGIATSSAGGYIQVLDPGGQIVLGVAGSPAPGAGSGIISNGPGDIDIFAESSVLLGKSRIFTTDGGNLLIWSAAGDINAGIGAKTTIIFNPPTITYDTTGGYIETPAVPSSGAGIATLQPFDTIAAGNIILVAPFGKIDPGEAGIRAAGNISFVGQVVNVANIQVGGKTSGIQTVSGVSLGAAAAAAAAAGAAASTAQSSAANHAVGQLPSILEVEVLSVSDGGDDEERKRRRK